MNPSLPISAGAEVTSKRFTKGKQLFIVITLAPNDKISAICHKDKNKDGS